MARHKRNLMRNQQSNPLPTPDLPQARRGQLTRDHPRAIPRAKGDAPRLKRQQTHGSQERVVEMTRAHHGGCPSVAYGSASFPLHSEFPVPDQSNFRAPLWPHNSSSYVLQCGGKETKTKRKVSPRTKPDIQNRATYITATLCLVGCWKVLHSF